MTFLWAGRDRLIPRSHADYVSELVPQVPQLEVACSGHFVNFVHFRCMEHAIVLATSRILDAEQGRALDPQRILTPCIAGRDESPEPFASRHTEAAAAG